MVGVRRSFSRWTLSYSAFSAAAFRPARLRLAQFTDLDRLRAGSSSCAKGACVTRRPSTAKCPRKYLLYIPILWWYWNWSKDAGKYEGCCYNSEYIFDAPATYILHLLDACSFSYCICTYTYCICLEGSGEWWGWGGKIYSPDNPPTVPNPVQSPLNR